MASDAQLSVVGLNRLFDVFGSFHLHKKLKQIITSSDRVLVYFGTRIAEYFISMGFE